MIKDPLLVKSYHFMTCLLCDNNAEPHHIKSKGSGGDDHIDNLAPLCRAHHTEVHMKGTYTFSEKYKVYKKYIFKLGWYFEGVKLRRR